MTKLEYGWKCLACGEGGSGDDSNKAAERHTQRMKHPTRAFAVNPEAEVRRADSPSEGQGGPVPEE